MGYDEKYLPYDKGEPLVEKEIGSVNADSELCKILLCDKDEPLLVLYRTIIYHETASIRPRLCVMNFFP